MKHESKSSHPIFQLKSPWQEQSHPIWIATHIHLKRNLKPYKFPEKEEKSRRLHIYDTINQGLKEIPQLQTLESYKAENLEFHQKEYLLEHFIAAKEYYQIHGESGLIFDPSGRFFITVNYQDHMHIHYLETKQEIESGWSQVLKVEGEFGKKAEYAFDPTFGYLTSNPLECGTALNITLFLHLPAIIHMGEMHELIEHQKEEEVEVTSLQENMHEIIGDLLLVKNKCTLGLSEEHIITSMRVWATKALVSEMNWRKKLIESQDATMKNKITRALGLLTHSFQMELVEAMNSLSLVKLGVELGWIQAPSQMNFNSLLFNCRRAHLMQQLGESIEADTLSKKRAEYLQSIAKQLTLKI